MKGPTRGKIEVVVAGASKDEKGKAKGIGKWGRTEVVKRGASISREKTEKKTVGRSRENKETHTELLHMLLSANSQ